MRHKAQFRFPPKRNRGGTLLGICIGLVVGLLIAFGVAFFLNKSPLPFQNKARQDAAKIQDAKPGASAQQLAAPMPLPGKPGDKVGDKESDKPRFEFYKILPGSQEATPGQKQVQPAAPAPAPAQADEKMVPAENFYLQAGAFQKSADADNLKAKLALMGVGASVQEVVIPEKGTMHRVRVGPFAKTDEMNRVRNELSQNGIQTSVVKMK